MEISTLLIWAGIAVFGLFVAAFVLQNKKDDKEEKKRNNTAKDASTKAKKEKKVKKSQPRKDQEKTKEKKKSQAQTFTNVEEDEDEMESVLEFLKGRDNEVVYKVANKQLNKEAKKKKKSQEKEEAIQSQSSEDSGEGEYITIEKKKVQGKKVQGKKKKKSESEDDKPRKKGSFWKPEISKAMREAQKESRKAERAAAAAAKENNWGETDLSDEKKEGQSGNTNEEKKEKEPRTFPMREPPKIAKDALEPLSLDDLLNSITKWYNTRAPASQSVQKDKDHIFSKLPKAAIDKILFNLEARDLVALSRVNKYFNKNCKSDHYWKALCEKDLNVTEKTQRTWKFTYKEEYKRTKSKILKKGEAKDHLERAWHTYFLECEDPKPVPGYTGPLGRFAVEDVKRVIAICLRDLQKDKDAPKKEDSEDEEDCEAIGVFELWDSRFVSIWASNYNSSENVTKCRVASNYPTLMKYGLTEHQRRQLKQFASGVKIAPSQLVGGSKASKGESKAKTENSSKTPKPENSPKTSKDKGENKPKGEKGSKAETSPQK